MDSYYVNKEKDHQGDHEVHVSTCYRLPKEENRIYLGRYGNCKDAIKEAQKHFHNVDGCYYCTDCHTG